MNPRRLIPLAVLLIVAAGAYFLSAWHQERQAAREQEAKRVFQVKAEEITGLTLRRDKEEIQLAREGKSWRIVKPLKDRADERVLEAMLFSLARLDKEQELPDGANLSKFGLDKPTLIVEVTAAGRPPGKLIIGGRAPGVMGGYYALKDQDPRPFIIKAHDLDVLNRKLSSLRDKVLFRFKPEEVTALTVISPEGEVRLEKTGPLGWRWVGRDEVKVRGDRVEHLLRGLTFPQVQDFVADEPKSLEPYGLAPKPQVQVVIKGKEKESLTLGAKAKDSVYALKGEGGPVVLVDAKFPERFLKLGAALEDRRFWEGPVEAVPRLSWGAPGKIYTAVKGKDNWTIKGLDGKEIQQPLLRLERALEKLRNLEYLRRERLEKAPLGGEGFRVELFDQGGKLLLSLQEAGAGDKDQVELASQGPQGAFTARVARPPYLDWQKEMARLTTIYKK